MCRYVFNGCRHMEPSSPPQQQVRSQLRFTTVNPRCNCDEKGRCIAPAGLPAVPALPARESAMCHEASWTRSDVRNVEVPAAQ